MANKKIRKPTGRPPELEVERLERAIGELPTIPPRARTDTKRYLIEQLRGPLRQAMTQRGYSFAELAAALTREGLTVHASTLRQYLGPIDPRRVAPPTDPPPTAEPSPARAGRTAAAAAAASERPGAGAAGSPEALARPEAALAEAPMPAAGPPARPTPPLSGRFVPKPELPYDELIRRSEAQKAQTP